MDPDILAHRVATGTSIHPVNSLNQDGLQQIIHTLYEITDKIDTKFELSERFSKLSARKRMLSQEEPFACWPNGTCFRAENGEKDPFQFNYWRISEDDIGVWNEDLMVEDTSLHHFVRYIPHLLLGVYANFDSDWAISEKDIQNGDVKGLFGATLSQHKHANTIQQSNRERLAGFVGDPSVQRISWDNERLMINDLPEEEYISINQQHMMAYFKEVGLQPDWGRNQGEVVCEHAVWLCLYPSWQSEGGRVTNLIPVIVGNYGGAGANGELVVAEAEAVISESFVRQTLLGGKTILERLEEILWVSDSRAVPEVISELERTALFIEEHPLLKRYRKLDMGMKYIADWGNALDEHNV
ncbi:hypothetical protein ThimaDRAFT_0831 [Thiocapsa marina 5811]|uniref:Uncharacterized protein n=2 Tax=Thiocapsa marina TaxID=244573 RepID=F9U7C9_9GAMM|nr:hypothetical protein ThimaDRAFT_0831 [Thiocapsa marina 5811]